MARVEPLPLDLPARLATVTLPDTSGQLVTLGKAWERESVLLIHLRHFGCLFCRQRVADLVARQRAFEEASVRIVAIGTGDLKYGQEFKAKFAPTLQVLVDTGLRSYDLVRAHQGTLLDWTKLKVLKAAVAAARAGHLQGRLGNSHLFNGATNLIAAGGTLLFSWRNDDFPDEAPLGLVLDTARGGLLAGSSPGSSRPDLMREARPDPRR